ncbi:MAG TPA: hypothetical protein VG935_03370 [Patescibacteria group bacterium]|nr:hypothetical protein [Patescibacteria group bacterium]
MLNEISTIHSFEDIRLFYFKYKDTPYFSIGMISFVCLISLILFWKAVLPQLESWFSLQDQIKQVNEQITALQANQTTLGTISSATLDDQFNTATQSLPYAKDFAGIISAVDDATIISGVQRDDYAFEVGDLSTQSAQLSPETSLSLKITLRGDIGQVQQFLQAVNKLLPLSEVVTLSYGNDGATVGLIFFYKYLPTNLQINYTDPLKTLTPEQSALLKKLEGWRQDLMTLPVPSASNSAEVATQSASLSP